MNKRRLNRYSVELRGYSEEEPRLIFEVAHIINLSTRLLIYP